MPINSQIRLTGRLNLELDKRPIQLDAEDSKIKLTFQTTYSLLKFLSFYRQVEAGVLPLPSPIKHLEVSYFVNDYKVGESGSSVPANWIGSHYGVGGVKIHTASLIKSIFHF